MTTTTNNENLAPVPETIEQHSIGKSLALHLLPGVFILALFVASVPFVMRAGFPPMFAMIVFGATLGLGFQIWHLYHEGKKRNGKWSLEGIAPYRNSMPLWQYFAFRLTS